MKLSKLLWGAALVAGLITGPAIALPAAPAEAVTATTLVTRESPRDSQSAKTVSLACPASAPFLYGPGGSVSTISGAAGNVSVDAVVPVGTPPTGVQVTAVELGVFTGTWSVTAWAICGPFTTDIRVVSRSSGTNTVTAKQVDAGCQTELGHRLYGTGFRVSGGNGNVVVHDVIPGVTLDPRSLTVRATARPGSTPNWRLDAFAICAIGAPTMRIDQATTLANSNPSKGASKACTAPGTGAHGVGVQTSGSPAGVNVDGRIALTTTVPLNTLSGGAGGVENGTVSESWQVTVYVICSN